KMVIDEHGTVWYLDDDLKDPEYESIPVNLIRHPLDGVGETVTTFLMPGAVIPGRGRAMSMVPNMVAAPGGGVIIAPNHTYELQLYTSESREPKDVWRFTSFETPYSAREKAPGGRGGFTPAGGELIEAPLLPHKPDVVRMVGVSREEIWIETPLRNGTRIARIDRIDYQGNRIESFWMSNRYSHLCCAGDRLYTLGSDYDGSMQVFAARMTMEPDR
ncbi:hypothetical protein ACFL6R_06970, partial [Gemmatimonadota bacterium]